MNLLERLQQGQTLLSAGSFPNDAPINDPQSGFIQSNLPNSTYEDETIGQPNNGSILINTLDNTALDITNFNQSSNIDAPTYDWVTNYPPLVSGEFNSAPSLYELTYTANNTYLDNIPIQTENSPQLPTLSSSSLDNTGSNASTTIVPDSISYPNNYPTITDVYLGEFRGAPSPYETIYNPDNTYLVDVPIQTPNSPQIPTLDQTSLDNADTGNVSTTNPVPNANTFPNNYPTPTPQIGMGKFGLQPNQYTTIWAPNNKYYSQFNYNNIITNSSNPLINYMNLTGLTLDPNSFASFIQTYPFNQTYLGSPGFPPFVTGQFNGSPSIFQGIYDTGNTYLNTVPIQSENSPQTDTFFRTGLDNTNAFADATTFIPNSNSVPNNYPEIESVNLGSFNGAPNDYQSIYNANNTYLSNIPVQDPNSTQINTLSSTGLDNTNTNSNPTTIVPDSIAYPNIYPALTSGEFNGASSQYTSPYNSENPYLNSIPIQDPNSPQIPTLGETGLDLDNSEYSPTAIQPSNIAYPNNYPAIEGVNLGGFGGPEQYDTNWNQDNTYFNNFNPDSDNSIQLAFTGSNLDNTSTAISTLSHVTPPLSIYKPNNYPIIPHVYLGEFNSGPSQYITPYTPSSSYLEQYDELKNETTNPQINTLDETGLDVENSDALSTSLLFAPTNPDNITTYPVITGINLGVTGSGAQGFNQVYKPSNTYWDNYLTNRLLFDTLTV